MIAIATVWEVPADEYTKAHWVGECESIRINTNCKELVGELVQFLGESRESVISQIIDKLKSRGISGSLRVRK